MDRRWILGTLLIAGGVGLAAAATRRPRVAPGDRVLVFGDSLAVGLIPHLDALAEESGVALTGRGEVGTRIDQWSSDSWLIAELESFQPTLVLVSLGTNDEAIGPGAVEREAPHLARLLALIEESGAELVWIGPPALPFPSAGIATMIEAAVPYYFDSERYDIPRAPDHLHPTAAGYAGWAGAIWRWLT